MFILGGELLIQWYSFFIWILHSLEFEVETKRGTDGERLGKVGGFWSYKRFSTGGLDEVKPFKSDPGVVLATYPMLKPRMDYSGPMTNDVGGRPTERRGVSGGVIRNLPVMSGGCPREVPLPTPIDPGMVLERYPELKKNVKEIVGTNDVGGRPDERLGIYGSFTKGIRTWSGGEPHDIPKNEKISSGTVLAQFPYLKVEDTVVNDKAPIPIGTVLARYPELSQKSGEVEERQVLPLHVKDKTFNGKETKLNFKPWTVPNWKPKLGVRPISGQLSTNGDIKFRSTAAPSA